jgi:hypothetical protein
MAKNEQAQPIDCSGRPQKSVGKAYNPIGWEELQIQPQIISIPLYTFLLSAYK